MILYANAMVTVVLMPKVMYHYVHLVSYNHMQSYKHALSVTLIIIMIKLLLVLWIGILYTDGSSSLPRSRLQSSRNDMVRITIILVYLDKKPLNCMQGFIRRRFYSREQRIHQQGGNTKYAYQETPAARLQQEFINERKFRSRPRVAGQPSA